MTYLAAISKPPLHQTRLNRRNKLAPGLLIGLPLTEGSTTPTTHDFSNNGNNGTISGATWTMGAFGPALVCTGGNFVSVPFPAIASTDSYTLLIEFFPTTWPGGFTALLDDSARQWSLFFSTSGNVSFVSGSGLMKNLNNTNPGMSAGSYWQLLITRSAGVLAAYANGTAFMGTTDTQSSTATTVNFGNNPSTGGSNFNGNYLNIALWKGVGMSLVAVASLYADSWQMYRPVRRTRFGNPPAGTTLTVAYSLPLSWTSTERRVANNPLEELATLRRIGNNPDETLSSLLRAGGSPDEWLAGEHAVAAMPDESVAGLQRAAVCPDESTSGLRLSYSLPIEWLAAGQTTLVAASSCPVEWLATLARPASNPVEYLAKLQRAMPAPDEVLAACRVGLYFPDESLGLLSCLAALPLESLSLGTVIVARGSLPIEWIGTAPLVVGNLPVVADTIYFTQVIADNIGFTQAITDNWRE